MNQDSTNSSCFGRLPDFLKVCAEKVFREPRTVEFHLSKLCVHLSDIEWTHKGSVRPSDNVAIQNDLVMPNLNTALHFGHFPRKFLGDGTQAFSFALSEGEGYWTTMWWIFDKLSLCVKQPTPFISMVDTRSFASSSRSPSKKHFSFRHVNAFLSSPATTLYYFRLWLARIHQKQGKDDSRSQMSWLTWADEYPINYVWKWRHRVMGIKRGVRN